MVIEDQGGDVFVHPMEIMPLRPDEFLKLEIEYVERSNQLVATVSPKERDLNNRPKLFPQNLESQPIFVQWEFWEAPDRPFLSEDETGFSTAGQLFDQGDLAKEIKDGSYTAKLWRKAELKPGAETFVRFNVDGYPRAFALRVRPNGSNDLMDEIKLIRINTVEAEDVAGRQRFAGVRPLGESMRLPLHLDQSTVRQQKSLVYNRFSMGDRFPLPSCPPRKQRRSRYSSMHPAIGFQEPKFAGRMN